MTEAKKDTIYIDVDDEITSIVDKVQKSSSKIVALVLPKRAAVLQSVVNMKLLKRASDDAGKRVVLITSEAGLMPLAGAVGVYTAKNLQSKPEIPAAPESLELADELLESEDDAVEEPELNKDAPVGDLADEDADDDVFESAKPATAAAAASKREKAPKQKKPKKDKKNKVPNFDLFRKKVLLAIGGGIALLALCYYAFFIAPKAKAVIVTQTSTVNSSIEFTASTSTDSVDTDSNTIPAKVVEKQNTDTQKVPASGKKDLGTKATGSVTLSVDCGSGTPTVPAGTGVSANGLTFITASTVTVASFPDVSGGGCTFNKAVGVKAQSNGDQYNLGSGQIFSVAGFSDVSGTNGSAFTGGTTKMATVVSQQDVDKAKQQITDSSEDIKKDLQKQLETDGYYAITDTFTTKKESITASPQVDQEASEVTVTADRTYSMTGVKRDDLHTLIAKEVQPQLDEQKLQIQDDGIDQAVFRVGNQKGDNTVITIQVPVILGPKIDEDQVKNDIAGKKKGDAENIIKGINGVEDVTVSYSPFWVSTTPKNINKITLEYKEASN